MFAGQNCFKSYTNLFGAKIIVTLLHNQCIIMLILKNVDQAMLAREINCVFYRSLYQDGKEHRFCIGRACAFLSRFFFFIIVSKSNTPLLSLNLCFSYPASSFATVSFISCCSNTKFSLINSLTLP